MIPFGITITLLSITDTLFIPIVIGVLIIILPTTIIITQPITTTVIQILLITENEQHTTANIRKEEVVQATRDTPLLNEVMQAIINLLAANDMHLAILNLPVQDQTIQMQLTIPEADTTQVHKAKREAKVAQTAKQAHEAPTRKNEAPIRVNLLQAADQVLAIHRVEVAILDPVVLARVEVAHLDLVHQGRVHQEGVS